MNEDYPFTLEISQAELVALIKWHGTQVKSIAKKFGKVATDDHIFSKAPSARDLKILHDVTKGAMEKHINRARGLASLLK
jgi:hypothetical protein